MSEEIISIIDYFLNNPIVIAYFALSAIVWLICLAVTLVIIIKVIMKLK